MTMHIINETLLGGKSTIITDKYSLHEEVARYKFTKRFKVIYYTDIKQVNDIAKDYDMIYCIKHGMKDGFVVTSTKMIVHCVFDVSAPHGDKYVAVSKTLAKKFDAKEYVPHMISLKPSIYKQNLREKLGIPKNAIVFGRYGGRDTFDLLFARNMIINVVNKTEDKYFLFMNTPMFYKHPKVIFMDKTSDLDIKNKFIQTCDAYLECGTLGHSFGLAMGEFSINNIPIIAYTGNLWNIEHIAILREKGIYYGNSIQFHNILMNFTPETYRNRDNNCYRDYTPENVMGQFKKVFIDNKSIED